MEREAVLQLPLNVPEEVKTELLYPEQKPMNALDKLLADIEENTNLSSQQKQELGPLVRELEGYCMNTPGNDF